MQEGGIQSRPNFSSYPTPFWQEGMREVEDRRRTSLAKDCTQESLQAPFSFKGLLEGLAFVFFRSHPTMVTISPHILGLLNNRKEIAAWESQAPGALPLPRPMWKTPARETS